MFYSSFFLNKNFKNLVGIITSFLSLLAWELAKVDILELECEQVDLIHKYKFVIDKNHNNWPSL